MNNTTDICNASRPMRPDEREKIKERTGSECFEIPCALDGLSVYVNTRNPVQELSIRQLLGIYEGRITTWDKVGGASQPIILFGRETNSGTYEYFKEHILLDGNFSVSVRSMASTAAIADAVRRNADAIGYGGAAYGMGILEIKIKADEESAAYAPTPENIRSRKYPISRTLFMYLKGTPKGVLKDFIDWALSDEGQRIIMEVGYFRIR